MVKKGGHLSEEHKKKISAGLRGHRLSLEGIEKVRKAHIGMKASEETKQKLRDSHKNQRPSKETIERIRVALKGKMPKNFQAMMEKRGPHLSDETKKKISETRLRIFADKKKPKPAPRTEEEKHMRRSQAHKDHPSKYWQNKHMHENMKIKMCEVKYGGFWYGAVRYYDGKQYCEKFNHNFRERVRAYFNWICPICGTPQNGKKLSVHHVNYNKKSCCDPEAPRLFIPLCSGDCHLNTNRNREKWEGYFTEMLMGYYQGKSYFTIEEMTALNPLNPFS